MSDEHEKGGDDEQLDPEQEAKSYRDYIAEEKEKEAQTKKKSPFDKVGLLTKLGGYVKNWLERGFALQSDYKLLHYFRSARDFKLYAGDPAKNAGRIAGTINLVNARMFLAFYAEFDNCLEISTDEDRRHYYVYAKSRLELQSWIKKLAEAGVSFICPTTNNDELKMILQMPNAAPPLYGMQGFIEKRGKINTAFKKRFFRIETKDQSKDGKQVLAYYVRYDDTKNKGYIELEDAKITDNVDSASSKSADQLECQFTIETNNRKFVLRTTTKKEKQIWLDILKMFVKNPRGPPPQIKLPRPVHPVAADAADPAPEPVAVEESKAESLVHIPHAQHDPSKPNEGGPDADPNDSDSETESAPAAAAASPVAAAAAAAAAAPNPSPAAPVAAVQAAAPDAAPAPVASPAKLGGAGQLSAADAALLAAQAAKDAEAALGNGANGDAKAAPAADQKKDDIEFLKTGAPLTKHGRQGAPHKKWIRLADNKIYWLEVNANSIMKEDKSMKLTEITRIEKGKTTDVFKRNTAKNENESHCFSLVAPTRTLDLVADSEQQRDQWVAALEIALKAAKSS